MSKMRRGAVTKKHYRGYPKKRPVCICNDCGVDCAKIGEWYMAAEIWDTLHLGWNDNLCIGCLEQRLGRRIAGGDFSRWPNSPWEFSLRLAVRVFGAAVTTRKPYRVRKGSNVHIDRTTCKRIAEYLASEPPLVSPRSAKV
jgi:hypothetical protein